MNGTCASTEALSLSKGALREPRFDKLSTAVQHMRNI
jgi:hypothetical protein